MTASPPESALPPGFHQRYQFGEELGRGAFGRVHRARGRSDDRALVVKLMEVPPDLPAALRARYQEEIRLLEQVDHPNVVRLVEAHEEGGWLGLAFLDVAGRGLDEQLDLPRWREDEDQVRELLAGVLAGLEALARVGVVHRDLKPANILLAGDGRPMLLDLGLAKQPGASPDLTRTGMVLGSPGYMAPQQVLGQDPDPRDDLYSLGVVAYQLLTGRNPFAGGPIPEMLERQLSLNPPMISEVNPAVSVELGVFVGRLLHKEREDRFAGPAEAGEVLAALGRTDPGEAAAATAILGEGGAGTAVLGAGAATPLEATRHEDPQDPGAPAAPLEPEVVGGPVDRPQPSGLPRHLVAVSLTGMALLLAGFLWWGSAPAPGTATAPARATAPTPSGEPASAPAPTLQDPRFGEWAQGEVSALLALPPARTIRHRDPRYWPKTHEALAPARSLRRFVARGGTPEALPAETLRALQHADRRMAEAGLGRPFWPAAFLEPAPSPVPFPSGVDLTERYPPAPEPPATLEGWLGTAATQFEAWAIARARLVEDVKTAVEGGSASEIPPGLWERSGTTLAPLSLLRFQDKYVELMVREAPLDSGLRREVEPWLAPSRAALEGILYAVARAAQDADARGDPATGQLATILGQAALHWSDPTWASGILFTPVEGLLWGPATGPHRAALACEVLSRRSSHTRRLKRSFEDTPAELVTLEPAERREAWKEAWLSAPVTGTAWEATWRVMCAEAFRSTPKVLPGERARRSARLRTLAEDLPRPHRISLLSAAMSLLIPANGGTAEDASALAALLEELAPLQAAEEVARGLHPDADVRWVKKVHFFLDAATEALADWGVPASG
jgi:hypothetical protein